MKDLYKILNIEKNANIDDIKKSYKKLAFKYHPDKNSSKDSEKRFKDISEAYEILSNETKRNNYDKFGYDGIDNNFINPMDLFQNLFNIDFSNIHNDLNSNIFVFSDLSGDSFSMNNLKNKMNYYIDCTIRELYYGVKKEFSISHMTRKGEKNTKYIINVKKGTKDGDNIVVKEGGNYIPQLNITEDLIIIIKEKDDIRYKRKGNDLYIEENISLLESLIGLEKTIEHLSGELQFKIDNIIKPNEIYKIPDKGMPIKYEDNTLQNDNINKEYGDLLIDLKIDFPDKLSDNDKELLSKILPNKKRINKSKESLVAYYYKEKVDVVKELINDDNNDNEDLGCIQQ
jgi:DnaJ-class molecular chaperone